MAGNVQSNNWLAGPDEFAVFLTVDDAPGLFRKQVTIEPGTRALILEDGQSLGEVGAGTYTLETFAQKLCFWRRKQVRVILTRQEEFPFELDCDNLPTAENLVVTARVRLTVQIDDVAFFAQNLMGSRDVFTSADLRGVMTPIIQQALREAVGRLSITELTGPEARTALDATIERALASSLRRYGLRFGQVRTISISHTRYDEQRRKQGEIFLWKESLAAKQKAEEVRLDDVLQGLKGREKQNELDLLSQQIAADRLEGELGAKLRRIGVRNEWRAAVLSEKFDVLKNEEEMARFLQERDQSHLFRADEFEKLKESFREAKDDRQAARQHVVARLTFERDLEIQGLRADLEHAQRIKVKDHEIALAKLTESEANRRWLAELERERQAGEQRRQEVHRQMQFERDQARAHSLDRRGESWEEVLHEQKLQKVKGDVVFGQAELQSRLGVLERETETARRNADLEYQKRKRDLEYDLGKRETTDQFERMRQLRELNRQDAEFQLALHERQVRLQTELEVLRSDKTSQHELARLEVMQRMGADALVATASGENARLLAEMKKHEATQHAAVGVAAASQRNTTSAERESMYEKLNAAEKAKADAIAEAYKLAMQSQQMNVQQMIAALGGIGHQAAQPARDSVVVFPGSGAPTVVSPGQQGASGQPGAAPAQRVLICVACRAENAPTARFCASCGKQL